MVQDAEYEKSKKAIFETMSPKGRERILRIGYENWNPFPEPKDPRDRLFGSSALRSQEMVNRFFQERPEGKSSVMVRKDVLEICRGLLDGDEKAKILQEFCRWYGEQVKDSE